MAPSFSDRFTADKEVYRGIKRELKIITVSTVTSFVFGVSTSVAFIKPLNEDLEHFFAFKLFQIYCSNHFTVLSFIYRSSFPLIACVMMSHLLQVVYYTQHIRFQTPPFY
ncbi:hypothetical protein BDFB_005191 [Asbolus verrucosus]|uniref:Uncharacterized protein n=1 Tax=Asbolus verrucosus TaxID=1661398 RepID=A0A482W1J9_ASBVE|nr:hypothetical protein BDFB_005191 [Asbolus verrucosus]